jgi:hypothetical protein
MIAMVLNVEVDDYDEFKKRFDSDPGGRKGIAIGHTVSRNVENPNDVFIRTEYASVEDANKCASSYSTPAPSATSTSRRHPPSSKSQSKPPIRSVNANVEGEGRRLRPEPSEGGNGTISTLQTFRYLPLALLQ